MPEEILVTGGTGNLGRLVVARLLEAGRPVRVLSRSASASASATANGTVSHVTGDLTTGEGVDAAVRGAGVIVHCAGSQKGDGEKAAALVRAARAGGGNPHVVYIGVVGADRVPVRSAIDRAMFGYFESKLAAERVIAESGLPWSALRATQFHDLILTVMRGMSKLPIVPLPSGFRFQPVDAGDVAARLAELALGEPAGLVPDLAGPRIYPMRELLRSYLDATGKHRAAVPLHLPGGAARAYRDGANLAPDRAVGTRTWEDFLAASV
jgi:uncharacterized protein YbjT (DUF2867 family)